MLRKRNRQAAKTAKGFGPATLRDSQPWIARATILPPPPQNHGGLASLAIPRHGTKVAKGGGW